MHPDEQLARLSVPAAPDHIRHQVVELATEAQRSARISGSDRHGAGPARGGDRGGHAATDLYLALLQDKLPVYVRSMVDLRRGIGQGSVRDSLLPVARATFDFYASILGAKVRVIADPDQIVLLRDTMRERGLGPAAARDILAAHLCEEQELGRVDADVSPDATASLLIGACVNYAFTALLMGEADLPPREIFIASLVGALRL